MGKKLFLSAGECMIEMSSLNGTDFKLGFAGDTLNTAWYMRACLDATQWDVAYYTRIGTDDFSIKMRQFLLDNHINADFIQQDSSRQSGLYLIELQDGERHFTYWRDRSAAKLLAVDEDKLNSAFDQADVIYFSAITLAILSPEQRAFFIETAIKARKSGKTTIFDTNIRPRLWETPEHLRNITMQAAAAAEIILPSFDDEAAMFGDETLEACAARYHQAGAGLVVIKNGGGTMLVSDNHHATQYEGLERLIPVDTTGAGDSFNGGFLAAYLNGADTETSVKAGHHIASQVVMHRGALMPYENIAPYKI